MTKKIIIAEAGVNHNGSIELAKELIECAANSGADFVKFQTFKAKNIVSRSALKADYQKKTTPHEESQYSMLQSLELTENDHLNLIDHCNSKNIKFLSSAFDIKGLIYLNKLGLEVFKIPSGEITNYPYLKKISEFKKPVILSTGMANMSEIDNAINILISGNLTLKDITILHCNTEYPTPMSDVNLLAMLSIQKEFGLEVGYSDHTQGIEVSIAAAALGAKIIEKHFTLDKNLPGPDHKASLDPKELTRMISAIRNVEKAMSGNGIKEPSKSELKNILIVRKSIHLNKNLSKGDVIKEKDIISLRPGNGISSISWNDVIGKTLVKDKKAHDKLIWSDLL